MSKKHINIYELNLSDEHMGHVYRFLGLGKFDQPNTSGGADTSTGKSPTSGQWTRAMLLRALLLLIMSLPVMIPSGHAQHAEATRWRYIQRCSA